MWGQVKFTVSKPTSSPNVSEPADIEELTYWFTVGDVVIDFYKLGPMDPENFSAIKSPEKKLLKIALFVNGSSFIKQKNELNKALVKEVFDQALYFLMIGTAILIILGVMRVKRLAKKMTAQIIFLYETLSQIASDRKRKGVVGLSFKHTCKELNELHLTFNRVARTINLSSQSMSGEAVDDEQA